MAMLFADAAKPDHPIIFVNDSFLSLTGYDREEVLGKSFNFLMANAADAQARTRIKAEFEGLSSTGTEVLCCRKDGSEFWAAVFISPVRNAGGDIVQYFASLIDLTKHREDEVRSRMLIDELNHRVKNILSTVQSIVWQTLRTTTDPKAIRQSIESRLFALSRSHDLLTREKWESALPAKGSFGDQHCVQRACDECREIRRIVQRGWGNPDRMDDGDGTGRKTASAELEGKRWPAGQGAGTQGIWIAGARAWSGP
jgi:PAS domain S-box-containing protein